MTKGASSSRERDEVVPSPTRWHPMMFVSLREPHAPRSPRKAEEKPLPESVKAERRWKLVDARRAFSEETQHTVDKRMSKLEADLAKQAYLDAQNGYAALQAEEKRQARQMLRDFSTKIRNEAQARKEQADAAAHERRCVTAERLRQQALEKAKEERLRKQRVAMEHRMAEREAKARMLRAQEKDRMEREIQDQLLQTRVRERAVLAEQEARAKHEADKYLAETRREKREMWAAQAALAAEQKNREAAAVKAAFRESEAKRVAEEKRKRHEERLLARERQKSFRKKVEKEQQEEKAAKAGRDRAMKAALKEALSMQFKEDEHGKLTKIPDPSHQAMKMVRQLEAEQARAMKDLEAEIAAREAAMDRKQKQEALQRQLQVEAAQREVEATFKANQEKAQLVKEEQLAAEQAKYKQMAKETRARIEEENLRMRQAERAAERALQKAKATQFKSTIEKQSRYEELASTLADNRRKEQEEMWRQMMDWQAEDWQAEEEAKAQARRIFSKNLRMKEQGEAKLRAAQATLLVS